MNARAWLMAWILAASAGASVGRCDALPAASAFAHPGGLHTRADLDRMKSKVAAGERPWVDGWKLLIADKRAQGNYKASPRPNMGVSRQRAQDDAVSAYLNALRWHISGDAAFADCAVRNLNGWSATVNVIPSGNDQPGLGGIPIGSFALAAELLRDYPGWAAADQQRFEQMLLTYFYPAVNDFLTHHRNAHPTTYWANWDAANVLSLLAIGVYCDDQKIFDEGVVYYKSGIGMGSIRNATPFQYPGDLAQWQESGRDHAHAFGGLGLLVEACQVAWNQGVDLFGYDNDRILAGANYEAQYAQWIGVPYTFYTNAQQANQYWISANYRGRLSNCEFYELLYNHYAVVKGRKVPEVERFAKLLRPEGGNADLMGYGTLTHTIDAAMSPVQASVSPTPRDLTATAGLGRVELRWSPSGAYVTQGYEVMRATSAGGAYASVYSTRGNTSPIFTDTKVEAGKTYYYKVAALNQAGRSGESSPVAATAATESPLPAGWTMTAVGPGTSSVRAAYADAAGGTFVVTGGGAGIGNTADEFGYAHTNANGDVAITARLIDRRGPADKVGLMIRKTSGRDAPIAVLTLGEIGGRQARFGVRPKAGVKTDVRRGNDYTWTPAWMRLQRVGNVVIGSQSSDGVTWFEIGRSEIQLDSGCHVGLAVASGGKDGLATAMFDHVTIAATPPAVPAVPAGLSAAVSSDGVVLKWTLAGKADGIRVESSVNNEQFDEVADLAEAASQFVNTGIIGKRFYRIRAYTAGGLSGYSNTVSFTTENHRK